VKGSRSGRRPAAALVLLAPLWAALVGLSPAECPPIEEAYHELEASSFEVLRTFRFTVNDNLKRRELARLRYTGGELETEILEQETLSKTMVFEPDETDLALEVGFACERVEDLGEGRFAVASEDGTERAVFALDSERGALRPESWRLETSERLLFKKFVLEGVAEYEGFRWLEPEPPEPGDS
jgi:hypothetical protein